jgi:hypothetical protein
MCKNISTKFATRRKERGNPDTTAYKSRQEFIAAFFAFGAAL